MLSERRPQTLIECLVENAKGEVLGKDDMWYCSKCKEHRQAFKKMELWSVPDVLVIHLKVRPWRAALCCAAPGMVRLTHPRRFIAALLLHQAVA